MRTFRRSVAACALLSALAAQSACGNAEPVVSPPVTLAVVAAATPVPTGPTVVDLVLSVKDGVSVDGSPVDTLAALLDRLKAKSKPPRMRQVDGSSRLNVVLYVDEQIPWAVVCWAIQTACDETVMAYHLHFAVRHRTSGDVGALAIDLPKDRNCRPPPTPTPTRVRVRVRIAREDAGAPPSAEDVYTAARQVVTAAAEAGVVANIEVLAPHNERVPTGLILQTLGALRSAGIADVQFTGTKPPKRDDSLRAAITRLLALPPGVPRLTITADGQPIDATRLPIPDGLSPRLQPTICPPLGDESPPLPSDSKGGLAAAESPPEEELPPTPEETEEVHQQDLIAKEPTIKDAEILESDTPETIVEEPPQPGSTARAGPSRKSQDAVELALNWLAAHQSADGGWEAAGFGGWCDGKRIDEGVTEGVGKAKNDVGVTGLALLAFLGAGYTNRSDGPYGKVVQNALRYLRNAQDAEGCFGSRADGHFVESHAIATLAMLEAFRFTGSTNYKVPAQKALDFIALARNPYFAWRYGVKPGDNDTEVTAWMTIALSSARLANREAEAAEKWKPFVLDEDALEGVKSWLEKATSPATGRVGYSQRGTGPSRYGDAATRFPAEKSESLTAIGMLLRILLGEKSKSSESVLQGAARCGALPPRWDPAGGSIDFVYWTFGTLAMFHVGGDSWRAWEASMKSAIIDTQRADGEPCQFRGSWDPIDVWGADGGRVYSTALLAVCCEVWYRYERPFGTQEIK